MADRAEQTINGSKQSGRAAVVSTKILPSKRDRLLCSCYESYELAIKAEAKVVFWTCDKHVNKVFGSVSFRKEQKYNMSK